jgi:hypothetical protein
LCCDLNGIPWRPEGWRVGEVEFAEFGDGHVVEEGGGVGVDAFGGSGSACADELSTEELAAVPVAGDADADGLGTGVVGLVVIRDGGRSDQCKSDREYLQCAI